MSASQVYPYHRNVFLMYTRECILMFIEVNSPRMTNVHKTLYFMRQVLVKEIMRHELRTSVSLPGSVALVASRHISEPQCDEACMMAYWLFLF
ncbi:hypothetical protein Cadr_000030972 [Camelus dromedarius]|uniref:Uncharacterized protein n=1 Tax=Camelus dromedarius TaxID=9838 RepID=A0A5N4BZU3_CAMDR|nr:hypothetical protein Cadr_000030972 [Camelus dromedarius]